MFQNPQCRFCADGLLPASRPCTNSCSGTPRSPPAHPPAASCPSPGQSPRPGPRSHPHSPAALPSHFPAGVLAGPAAPQGSRHSSLLPSCSCLLAAVPRPPPPCLTATEKVDSHKRRSQGRRSHLLIPSGRSMSFPLSLRQAGSSLAPALQPPPALLTARPPPHSEVIHVSPKVAQQSPL